MCVLVILKTNKLNYPNSNAYSYDIITYFSVVQNVNDRHELLLKTIGTFQEEDFAHHRINLLFWVLPLTISIHAVVDAIMAYVYMKYAHPWRGILAGDGNSEEDKTSTSVEINAQEVHEKEGENALHRHNIVIENCCIYRISLYSFPFFIFFLF